MCVYTFWIETRRCVAAPSSNIYAIIKKNDIKMCFACYRTFLRSVVECDCGSQSVYTIQYCNIFHTFPSTVMSELRRLSCLISCTWNTKISCIVICYRLRPSDYPTVQLFREIRDIIGTHPADWLFTSGFLEFRCGFSRFLYTNNNPYNTLKCALIVDTVAT